MKFSSSIAAALLFSTGLARSVRILDEDPDDGTLGQRLKVNAFIIHKDGTSAVECWEVGDDFEPAAAAGKHSVSDPGHQIHIAGAANLNAVSLITWPPRRSIWPPSSYYLDLEDVHPSQYCPYCNPYPQIGTPCGGSGPIIIYDCRAYGACPQYRMGKSRPAIVDEDPFEYELVLTPENGNNWFYFHDARAELPNYREILAAEADDPPFIMTSAGATNAQVLSMQFDKFKNRTKLHDGLCKFGGVEIPEQESRRKHSHLDVNLRIQEL